jgi:hypothetical protein
MATQRILFLAVLLAVPAMVWGQDTDVDERIADCAAIEDNAERLTCYDDLARELGLVTMAAVPVTATAGHWLVSAGRDPGGERHVVLTLPASGGKSNWGKPISLIMSCSGDGAEVRIHWNEWLGSKTRVALRVDDGPWEREEWAVAEDKESTLYPGDTAAFFAALRAAVEVRAEVTPRDADPIWAVFDVRGLAHAVADLEAPCGWQ